MKDRLLHGWNITRMLYTVVGGILLIQAIADGQWVMASLGAYFAAMGIFRFGCAASACLPIAYTANKQVTPTQIPDADYEEVRAV